MLDLVPLGYGFSAILAFIGAIAYALGYTDLAKNAWIWSLAVAGVVYWVSGVQGPGLGAGEASVFCPPGSFYTKMPLALVVSRPGGNVSATVSWGDGESSTCSGEGYCIAFHSYGDDGVYTITVEAQGATRTCRVETKGFGASLAESIEKGVGGCGNFFADPLGCIASGIVSGLARALGALVDAVVWVLGATGASGVIAAIGMMLVTVPEQAGFMDLTSYATWLLGPAVAATLFWKAFWEFEKGFSWLDLLRETGFAVAAISLAQPAYTWAAKLVNTVSVAIAQPGIVVGWMSLLLAFTALMAALPVGGAGGLAAAGVLGFAGFVLIVLIKYLLLEALYVLLPLVAILWLFPGTRGSARSIVNLLVALMVWNIILAAMMGLSAHVLAPPARASPLEVIGFGVVMPVAMLVSGPMIAGLVGAPVPGAGVFARAWGLLAAARPPVAAHAAVLAAPGAVIGRTEYLRPPAPTAIPAPAGMGVGTAMPTGIPTLPAAPAPPAVAQWMKPQAPPIREIRETPPPAMVRIEELPSGRKWEAVRATGAALGRLEAYFENRARQFTRDFAVAFEARTGIRVPQRLKTITQLDKLDIETRKYMGTHYAEQAAHAAVKLGKTVYLRIRGPVASIRKTAILGSSASSGSNWY